jgi:hypothetical protein
LSPIKTIEVHQVMTKIIHAGCMQVGNTKLICEAVADSNISITKAQPAQTVVQPTPAGVD